MPQHLKLKRLILFTDMQNCFFQKPKFFICFCACAYQVIYLTQPCSLKDVLLKLMHLKINLTFSVWRQH